MAFCGGRHALSVKVLSRGDDVIPKRTREDSDKYVKEGGRAAAASTGRETREAPPQAPNSAKQRGCPPPRAALREGTKPETRSGRRMSGRCAPRWSTVGRAKSLSKLQPGLEKLTEIMAPHRF